MNRNRRSWLPISILLLSLFPISLSSHPHRHLLQSTPSLSSSTSRPSDKEKLVTAVIATAATSFTLSGLLFFGIFCLIARCHRSNPQVYIANPMPPFQPTKVEPNHKGVIVDENGLEALYWCSIDDASPKRCKYCNSLLKQTPHEKEDLPSGEKNRHRPRKDERGSQEIPLLSSNSVKSSSKACAAIEGIPDVPPPLPPVPPPPPPMKKGPTPPPPLPVKKGPSPPLPPKARRAHLSSSRPLAVPESSNDQPKKMKPLHWEKVALANGGQSMVWDKITDGSMKFDDDVIESLFGYVPVNVPRHPSSTTSTFGASPSPSSTPTPTQIRLLDPRKSQNIAIILRTLAVSRQTILDGLQDGHGLARDTLEKLSRISPTPDEASLILSYSGSTAHLSDAESFLFHILRAVPSAFPRIAALHFRSSVYDPEILLLKDCLQSLDLACKELRTQALFLKLLEATLKAGNRMNAGTARGNAQAFDLIALRKLSSVKSTDGKTSLLHFVVKEVLRSEGKRCAALNQTKSIRQSGSTVELEAQQLEREEREREYITLGLPIVGGLSVDFVNVKKAAGIDHDTLAGVCSMLEGRVADIQKLAESWEEEGGGFVREMAEFVEAACEEIEKMKEKQDTVMEKVRRTTEYYQPGASKDKATSLQLFVIVRDFLVLVDQACIDITKDLQKKKPAAPPPVDQGAANRLSCAKMAAAASLREERNTTRFPILSSRFMSSDKPVSSSYSEEGNF